MDPISRTHLRPNPFFFKFIKNMSRDSSNMSYTEHLLSSSSSLKNKEVLTNHGGGKLKEVGQVLWEPWRQFFVTLEYDTCLCLALQLVNFLASNQSHESCYSFGSLEECPDYHCMMFWSISQMSQVNVAKSCVMPHNVQGKFHLKTNHLQ
jgi:hypothetical protein